MGVCRRGGLVRLQAVGKGVQVLQQQADHQHVLLSGREGLLGRAGVSRPDRPTARPTAETHSTYCSRSAAHRRQAPGRPGGSPGTAGPDWHQLPALRQAGGPVRPCVGWWSRRQSESTSLSTSATSGPAPSAPAAVLGLSPASC